LWEEKKQQVGKKCFRRVLYLATARRSDHQIARLSLRRKSGRGERAFACIIAKAPHIVKAGVFQSDGYY